MEDAVARANADKCEKFGLEFEWDPAKAEINAEKHGITFEQAAEAAERSYYNARANGERIWRSL